jgi:hypothetical protein
LRVLIERLRDAKQRSHSGGDAGRDGAVQALDAVTDFLVQFRTVYDENLQTPLALLISALLALDDNVIAAILKPRPRRGRAPDTMTQQAMKAAAAFVVRSLQDCELDRTAACEWVAKQLRALGMKPSRGSKGITARTVRQWCDAIRRDVRKRHLARWVFDGLDADIQFRQIRLLPLNQARRVLFSFLRHCARQYRANEAA